MYAAESWKQLSQKFIRDHHQLYNLPVPPLLHVALSAGLSALKTPACYAETPHPTMAFAADTNAALCPICSPELNALARTLPYSQHARNIVQDPIVLPNGRVYSEVQLLKWCAKHGLPLDKIKDPMMGTEYDRAVMRKVYI